ncbi:MAG TPA: PH domain-containing protein [bacterium]|nr:PH domain-containing protein [bacterium]
MSEYTFKGQKEGEHVVLLLRRHWLTHLKPLLFTFVVFIVPLIAWFIIVTKLFTGIPGEVIWIAALVWFLLGAFFFVYNWLDWYLDIYLVTNQRVIDITQNGLFHRTVGATSLDNVQDVIYEIDGIIPTILNYGNVIIHTAGPTGDIIFEEVAHPQDVQEKIMVEVECFKDANCDTPATPEDLLVMMMDHERKKIEASETPKLPPQTTAK